MIEIVWNIMRILIDKFFNVFIDALIKLKFNNFRYRDRDIAVNKVQ